jgi:predicted pyridoxine 5'-phosphate oxidase superfamily flavin-nucleotide-binding protein
MSQAIPEKYRDLFQKRAFASLATLMPDGQPQVTPVWCDFDGEIKTFAAILASR